MHINLIMKTNIFVIICPTCCPGNQEKQSQECL